MSRDRFCEIKKYLRFDHRAERQERIASDKFALIRDIFDMFSENCRRSYTPTYSLCIDEQLMPLKTRCNLITYMPNKPDKFGVKFWLLVENDSKYVSNIIPYLGKNELRPDAKGLAHDVVISLLRPFLNKGYNITVDNFFPSVPLIRELNYQNTTLVGTIRPNRKGLPENLTTNDLELHGSTFFWHDEDKCLLVKYRCKQSKTVYLVSSLHQQPDVDDSKKKKPNIVTYYNKNKCGVDVADNMLRQHTTRCATRRWPLAIWQNILDIAALNAWILFRKSTECNISRKEFLLQLVLALCKKDEHESVPIDAVPQANQERSKCSTKSCRNKTNVICRSCRKPLCGKHCANEIVKVQLTICDQCSV